MDILITDITEMREGMYCVAGWCAEARRMVRPLPEGGNWGLSLVKGHRVIPGITIRVTAAAGSVKGVLPHITEDQRINLSEINVVDRNVRSWFGEEAPPSARTLADAFEGHVAHNSQWKQHLRGAHVRAGVATRSLWAVEAPRDRVQLSENDFGKLKMTLSDGSRRYELPVSSHAVKEAWKAGGMAGVNGLLPKHGMLHVRVGLARGYSDHPDKCFIMVNGIYG